MKASLPDPSDQISIYNVLAASKQACDSNGNHKGTSMWGVKHFTTESAAAFLLLCLYLKNKETSYKQERLLSSWKKVVDHFLKTYATDDDIA